MTPPADPLEGALRVAAEARRLFPYGGFEGLDANTLQVLCAVALTPRRTAAEYAHALALDGSTVRHAIGVLEDRHLLRRGQAADDRRRRPVALTASGKRLTDRFSRSL